MEDLQALFSPRSVALVGIPRSFKIGTLFLMGTDRLGRDILSRVIHGSRTVLMPVPLTFPGGISFAVQTVAVLGGDLHFSTPSVASVRL